IDGEVGELDGLVPVDQAPIDRRFAQKLVELEPRTRVRLAVDHLHVAPREVGESAYRLRIPGRDHQALGARRAADERMVARLEGAAVQEKVGLEAPLGKVEAGDVATPLGERIQALEAALILKLKLDAVALLK